MLAVRGIFLAALVIVMLSTLLKDEIFDKIFPMKIFDLICGGGAVATME